MFFLEKEEEFDKLFNLDLNLIPDDYKGYLENGKRQNLDEEENLLLGALIKN